MKIFHTADLHLGTFSGPEINGENARFLDMKGYLGQVVDMAAAETPDLIIVAGDLFHQAKVWSDRGLREQSVIVNFIRRLLNIAPVFVLRGTPNHDSNEQFQTLINTFGDMSDSLVIATEIGVYSMQVGFQRVNIAALPGYHKTLFDVEQPMDSEETEGEFYTKVLTDTMVNLWHQCQAQPADYNILVGHYTLQGCDLESGQTAFFAATEPIVDTSVLDNLDFDVACFGHIHKPQAMGNKAYYCGSIARMNFNDEGQDRGLWIHELRPNHGGRSSRFETIKCREFQTIKLDDADIAGIIDGTKDMSTTPGLNGKIVRVQYTCTVDHNKTFAPAVLEKQLQKAGVFYVASISPVTVINGSLNQTKLDQAAAPEDNLLDYLENDKKLDVADRERVVDLAEPIITEVMANQVQHSLTGMFVPVKIAVHNYRNYADESFDYSNIQCCTINGENGVGKSSLFMDAVVDALFEIPREGDLAGWIRNDPKAKSGRIEFTFCVGDNMFKVVRSRRKSGSPSLTLYAKAKTDADWKDISKARVKETQAEIEAILGMNAETFKACAFIMQDQYGLFLAADKEKRMDILGNLLGLGVYDEMEAAVSEKMKELRRDHKAKQTEHETIKGQMPAQDAVDAERKQISMDMEQVEQKRKLHKTVLMELQAQIEQSKLAMSRIEKLNASKSRYESRQNELLAQSRIESETIKRASDFLNMAAMIADGVKVYEAFVNDEKVMIAKKGELDAFLVQEKTYHAACVRAQNGMSDMSNKIGRVNNDLTVLDADLACANAYQAAYNEDCALVQEYNSLVPVVNQNQLLARKIAELQQTTLNDASEYQKELANVEAEIVAKTKQTELLANSGCIDQARATCRFLAAAQQAKAELPGLYQKKADMERELAQKTAALDAEIKNFTEQMQPDADARLKAIQARRDELVQSVRSYLELNAKQQQRTMLLNQKSEYEVSRKQFEQDSADNMANLTAVQAKIKSMGDVEGQLKSVQAGLQMNKHWVEDQNEMPVWSAKKLAAEQRTVQINQEYQQVKLELDEVIAEIFRETQALQSFAGVAKQADEEACVLNGLDNEMQALSVRLGSCDKDQELINRSLDKLNAVDAELKTIVNQQQDYEILKAAFSIDGIRHNIIRDVIPRFEATASGILSQMSGGRMRVEFVTEKVLKSSKKEVTTLDVIINDAMTGRLPYVSRSGGERVKAALSVILALAEIKATRAGIQLGYLGIDEPPYLDGPGAQAYCDALETIQRCYPAMKIMAITHDPSMKGRFPQSVEVVKDAATGHSRVICS